MRCPSCLSEAWKNGFRKSKINGKVINEQVYKCKKCKRQFTARSFSIFSRMRFPSKTVRLALKLHFEHNLSCYAISFLLSMRGEPVSHVTVYKWIKKYGPLQKKFEEAQKLLDLRKRLLEGAAK